MPSLCSHLTMIFYGCVLLILTSVFLQCMYKHVNIVIKIFNPPFYLISNENFASLFENFHTSMLKWTSTYMFGIEV